MGAVQDKFSSDSTYTRKMNDVEFEKQQRLQQLEASNRKHANDMEREILEMEKSKAKAESEIKKAEILLGFQTDIRKIEADLIKTRMSTQSALFGRFIDYMNNTLNTNEALIKERMQLYKLGSENEKRADYFFERADKIAVLDVQQLINIGLEKVKELNIESSAEMKHLQSRLEGVLGITDHSASRLAIAPYSNINN